MRVIKKAAVVVALLAGCTTYNRSRRVAEVGGYTIVTGASVAAIGVGYFLAGDEVFLGDSSAIFFFPVAALLIASGIVLGASGLSGMVVHDKPASALEPAPALPQVDPECLRRRAGDLKRAQEIADRGQRTNALRAIPICAPVLVPAQQVTP